MASMSKPSLPLSLPLPSLPSLPSSVPEEALAAARAPSSSSSRELNLPT